jgi:hypothetical protein
VFKLRLGTTSDSGMDTTNSGLGLGFGDATSLETGIREAREGEEDYAYGGHGYGTGFIFPFRALMVINKAVSSSSPTQPVVKSGIAQT